MPRRTGPIDNLTSQEIDQALRLLDEAIGRSELLMSVAPLRFITYGGMLAVAVFHTRQSTEDIDVLLDPSVYEAEEYRDELEDVVRGIAEEGNYKSDWFNDELKLFIGRGMRQQLFFDSFEQHIIAFEGANMVIYAGSLDFGLERKLRRLQERRGDLRGTKDASDAVAIVHQMKGESAHPLGAEYVRSLDRNGFKIPIGQRAIEAVSQDYIVTYQSQGIAEMSWDEKHGQHKYLDLAGKWVWNE
ncbi:hypothetical protein C8A00DRAFT_43796 [Chaetomidium leptoderma]|uniref:Uncharacterized protein n=1 Tax=Chaetomidium leptoderma TaxID=669021 RepID=A0AAN6ZWA0_9PEZI|nr:hypothetical protein C8A00DRAFT_43796 [Chaetomidium leptoderma]